MGCTGISGSVCLWQGSGTGQLPLNNSEVLRTRRTSVIPSADGQLHSSTSQLQLVEGWGGGSRERAGGGQRQTRGKLERLLLRLISIHFVTADTARFHSPEFMGLPSAQTRRLKQKIQKNF